MKLRKLTQIHQIEPTSRCNLRCQYCPHPKLEREKVDMEWDTFLRAMDVVDFYNKQGTQGELSFTGLGEATLHPRFSEMLAYARGVLPDNYLCFSSNGLPLFTREIAETCKQFNIRVFLSLHRPEVAGKTVALCREYEILEDVNMSAATSAFDWAGEIDWPVSADRIECDYLKDGWGVILVDGRVSTCCIDAHGKNIIGHINDELGSLETKPFDLCSKCHMRVPDFFS